MPNDPTSDPASAHQLADLGRVAGELIHDLANEVQVLHGWALVARGEAEQGHVPMAELERVVAISRLMSSTLRDVLDAIAGRSVSPELDFDPHALTEATLNDWMRELAPLNVRLLSLLPPNPRVQGRASFWARTLQNLLLNAMRHAAGQILVRLLVERGPGGRPWIVLRVEDDGPGVDPEERELIFRPLWRGDSGNAGLGLSSAAWAVAQLRGTLQYASDSTLGGAAFEVRVPSATPLPPEEPEEGIPPGALAGMRLLLIDDEPWVRMALHRLLARAGAEVREVDPVGMPADTVLRTVLGALPDFILLDLRIGERAGVSLWKQLTVEMPHLASRVVFISGAVPGDPLWEEAVATGQPVLRKPFEPQLIIRTLTRMRAGG